MLMHRTQGKTQKEPKTAESSAQSSNRYWTVFVPLSQRMSKDKPELSLSLENLKKEVGDDSFERYFESLISLKKIEETLWLVTDREFHRSLLLRDFVPQLKKAFDVKKVQVLSQAN